MDLFHLMILEVYSVEDIKEEKVVKDFSTAELLLVRQWLALFSNTASMKINYVRDAAASIIDVDKELWCRLISEDTPWGMCKAPDLVVFKDDDFDQTLESLKEEAPDQTLKSVSKEEEDE